MKTGAAAMHDGENNRSRRDFLQGMGSAAAGFWLSSYSNGLSTASAHSNPTYPELNPRARGWLNFLWEKATTEDDWSRSGMPHVWWDRYTLPGVLSYPRFDLHESTYALLMMADQTPAWREVYTRIVDELASRYPTYWGAIDWLTQIGDDPQREKYPPTMMNQFPEHLRGKYNRIGWTGNGVEPWGLQADPIGADGNLFFRGWFNLVLSIYKYVSGDDKWERPFKVTGYEDREFEWTQGRIVEHLETQWTKRPEGIHCENTKIWPICLSSAGLGLYLYDKMFGKRSHVVYENWLEFCKKNYMGVSKDGKLEWFTSYYDPIVNYKANGGPGSGIIVAFYLLPQDRELASYLYDAAANAAGWRNPRVPVQVSPLGLILARELGDHTAVARLTAAAERQYDPKFFGEQDEKFGWWFHLNEPYPRGQQSALMMVSEIGDGGGWFRAFQTPHKDKFHAPTIEGVDFPALGIYQAWNDIKSGTLHVGTYAASPDRRGLATSWRVTGLPNANNVVVLCNGQPFYQFQVEAPDSIRIDTKIENQRFQLFTDYRGGSPRNEGAGNGRRDMSNSASTVSLAPKSSDRALHSISQATSTFVTGMGPTCPCCFS